MSCCTFRLLRALIGLKRVIINAAHFLVMKNKEFYRFYQTEPFLETVRPDVDGHFSVFRTTPKNLTAFIQYMVFIIHVSDIYRMTDVRLKTLCLSAP